MSHPLPKISEVAASLQARSPYLPEVGIITGSGLGGLAEAAEGAVTIPYNQIPGFPPSTVEGHAGQLVLGRISGKGVFLMQGRAHYYEGYSLLEATFPIRVMRDMGAQVLMVTNAAGGLNPNFRPGDLMLITDHINLLGMAGESPLRGPNDESLGPRFPVMLGAYDRDLIKLAKSVARRLRIKLQEGVYIMLGGPTFESPAEVRLLRKWGADAVGMSTVPEVVAARHGGMRVLGISLITNPAGESPSRKLPSDLHQEVMAAGGKAKAKLLPLLRGIIEKV